MHASDRIPAHHQALNFQNNSKLAQKSVLDAKRDLRADLSPMLSSRHIWRGICSFSRFLKNLDSESQNRSEVQSDGMFGSSTLLGWKKPICFEKSHFRLFWKISSAGLPIAAQPGFWGFGCILALWKCYKFWL